MADQKSDEKTAKQSNNSELSATAEPTASKAKSPAEGDADKSDNKKSAKGNKGAKSTKADSSKTKATKKTPKVKEGRSRSKLLAPLVFLFLLLLGGLGVGAWYLYENIEAERDRTSAQILLLNQQIAELADDSSDTLGAQQNIERTLANFIGDQQRQMESLAERVRSSEGARGGDWLLAEAQYLVRLADQRLLVSRDTQSAVELLSGADDILQELAYPELVPVRQALIGDISLLRSTPSVDYQGLYFQISAASQIIDTLSLTALEGLETNNSENTEAEESSGFWSSLMGSIKSSLAQLFIVRKTEGSAQWMVDAEGEAILRGQLDLLVMQSLSSLLSGDQQIYQSALNEVANLLEANFQEGTARDALISELQGFADQPVQVEVPNITASMRAMQQGTELMRRIQGQ